MPRESFVIRIASLGEAGYETHVQSPAGEATAVCDLSAVSWLLKEAAKVIPANPKGWRTIGFDRLLAHIDKAKGGTSTWNPIAIGTALYKAVFVDEIQRLFDQSRGLVRSEEDILPIEFRFEPESPHEARLASLPWELLYDPEKKVFLAQREATPVTRYLAFDGRVRRFRAPAVLRVLVVASAPSDQAALQWNKELEILSGWKQANIVVDRLEQPDRRRLRRALRRGYHVLHFLGHGTFDEDLGGSIALLNEQGEADWVSGHDLAQWIVNVDSLRLVVLNACFAGANRGPEPFAGVASALVHGGVAAALAMRRPIPDGHALDFARVLYSRLAAGRPLDAALSSARQELAILDPQGGDWATPVLFTHTNDVFHVPVRLKEALTRVFSWLGALTATIAFNAWSQAQGSPQIPGFNFLEVSRFTVPIYGVLFVCPLLIPMLLLVLRYQRVSRECGLFHRFPIAFSVPIGDSRLFANLYQGVILAVFVMIPVSSQVYFQYKILNGDSWSCKGERVDTPIIEQFTKIAPFSSLFEHKHCFGAKNTKKGERNAECVERGEKVCGVTFFPFWQPWIFLLADLWAFVLFIAVMWGIWAPEPLFQTLRRSIRQFKPQVTQ